MPAANPPSDDRRRPLSAAARQGEGLRPLVRSAHPAAVPRLRLLDDLQRRSSRRIPGLWLGGRRARLRFRRRRARARGISAMRWIACSPARLAARLADALGRARRRGDRRHPAQQEARAGIRHRPQPGRHPEPAGRRGGRGAGDGGRRRHSSDLARAPARSDRQAAQHASEASSNSRSKPPCTRPRRSPCRRC